MDWRPLGDQAALGYAADEAAALGAASAVRGRGWDWVDDVVQAYASVAVFYDADRIDFAGVCEHLRTLDVRIASESGRSHRIPVCYDLGEDMGRVSESTGLSRDEIIDLHGRVEYRVYAIGFCPGFPYLGYLDERLADVPRLPRPRVRVPAGSVGLTGRQTGIYTEPRPGGWNLVGRTPLELVNVADGYFPLAAGDRVRFEPIDVPAFERMFGQRLSVE
jgi:inhibitor of KinA